MKVNRTPVESGLRFAAADAAEATSEVVDSPCVEGWRGGSGGGIPVVVVVG